MTSSAVVLAMIPVALKLGEGGEMYASLAVTVIGGMITSTVLTLILIPAVYTIFDDITRVVTDLPHVFTAHHDRARWRRLKGGGPCRAQLLA